MGIRDLNKVIKAEAPRAITTIPMSKFRGMRIAIDANNLLCSKMYTANKSTYDLSELKHNPRASIDQTEANQEWYRQLLNTVLTFSSYGITPIFVFDGKHLPAKANTHNKRKDDRKENQRRVDELTEKLSNTSILERKDEDIEKLGNAKSSLIFITSEQITTFKSILNMVGCPVLTAAGDGEDLCCALTNAGKVAGVLSKDTDCYVSCPLTITGISRDSRSPNQTFDVVLYDRILEGIKIDDVPITRNTFVDLCILGGCDYNNGVPGIRILTALKLLRKYKSIEAIMKYESHNYDFYGDDGYNVNLDYCRKTIFAIKSPEECLGEIHEGKLPCLNINKFALQHPQTRPFLRQLSIEDYIMRITTAYGNIRESGDYGAEYVLDSGRLLPTNIPRPYDVYILKPHGYGSEPKEREVLELREVDVVNPVTDMIRHFD